MNISNTPSSGISHSIRNLTHRVRRAGGELRAAWSYVRNEPVDLFAEAVARGDTVWTSATMSADQIEAAAERVRARLGESLERAAGGELVKLPPVQETIPAGRRRRRRRRRRWSVHCCALDEECRQMGAPARIQAETPWAELALGLRSGAGIKAGAGDYLNLGPLSVMATREQRCYRVVALEWIGKHPVSYRTCPLRNGHKGGCLEWKHNERVRSCRQEQRENK